MPIRTEYAFFNPEGKELTTTKSPVARDRGFLVMDNVWFARDEPDAIEPMPGFSAVNTSEFMNGTTELELRNMHFAYASDGTRMIVVAGDTGTGSTGDIFTLTTAGAKNLIKTGLTSDNIISIAQLNDLVFFANGVDTVIDSTIHATAPYVSDSGLTRLDVSGASAAQNAADVDAVRGTVKYFVAPFDEDAPQYARPDGGEGDQSDGWTNSSGSSNANLYLDIDETTQDNSDYVITAAITPGGGTETRTFQLSSVTDPSTGEEHTCNFAIRAPDGTTQIDCDVALIDDVDASAAGPTTIVTWSYTDIATTWTTKNETLTTTQANNITDYADLGLKFTFTNNETNAVQTLVPDADSSGSPSTSGTWNPGAPFWDC